MKSIITEFTARCLEHPNQLLFAFINKHGAINESYTYIEFDERTKILASYLQNKVEIKEEDRVLLAFPPGLEMIVAFFACVRIGAIPVPVYPPANQGFQQSLQKMNFIAADCAARAVLTDRSYFWSMKINQTRDRLSRFNFKKDLVSGLEWVVTSDARPNKNYQLTEARSEILFLQYTSGSTNQPKGVMVSHDNILYNADIVVDHKPIGVSWLPQYHDMGLIGYYLFFAIKGGTTYGFSPLDFINRPALWFETITKFKGTASSAPNFAYEYCMRPGKIPKEAWSKYDLSSLRFLMTAAEPVRPDTYNAFIEHFQPIGLNPQAYFSAYGLAEFSLAVSNYGKKILHLNSDSLAQNKVVPVIDSAEQTPSRALMSCGVLLGDTQVMIADPNSNQTMENNEIGEICITGKSKCKGYWNQPERTKVIFEAKLEGSEAQWLRTGDLGFVYDNELFICGRTKDMIIVRGLNYYPHDIELIVEQDKYIRKGCVVAFSYDNLQAERLVVIAELKSGKEVFDPSEINRKINLALGINLDELICIPPRSISKTSSGKIMRSKMKQRYESKDLEVLSRYFPTDLALSTVDEAEPIVNDYHHEFSFFTKYGISGNESESLIDLGFDSLKLAEFAYDLKTWIKQAGFSDLSNEVDLRLLQKIGISELRALLVDLKTSSPHALFRFKAAFNRIHKEYHEFEMELMKRDASRNLAEEIQWNPNLSQGVGTDVFLTGATGFFGPFLLKSLLEQCAHKIQVLVRANDNEEALNRLRKAFDTVKPSDELLEEFDKRVEPVLGDLSKPRFGLQDDQWETLDANIHTIYHNGAIVNYLMDYESMRPANVDGTAEILRLAMGKVHKTLNYISTTFIFGWSVKDTLYESDRNQTMERLDFGYSQSKWVAEQLVFNAIEQGLNARVFRPALISPTIHGDGYNFDIAIRLLSFMVKHKITTLAQNQVSFTPVDIGAHNIVAISNSDDSLGLTFHVTRDNFACMKDITNILGQLTHSSFSEFSLKNFVPEVVNRCGKEDLLFPLLNFLVRSVENISSMEFKLYNNDNFVTFRNKCKAGKADPTLMEVTQGIYSFMQTNQLID